MHTDTSPSTLNLPGVGKQTAKNLARLNIYSVRDLLFHLPFRYQDRTKIQLIRHAIPGQESVVEGDITHVDMPVRGRTKLACELQDESGRLLLRFFHVLPYQKNLLKPGTRLRCYGEVRFGPQGKEIVHPEFVIIYPNKSVPIEQHLTPIYPATEGVGQYTLRKLTQHALEWMERENYFQELLPQAVLQKLNFPTLKEALFFLHRPPTQTALLDLAEIKTTAQKRLIFEELLAHRMSLLNLKQTFQDHIGIPLLQTGLLQQFKVQLPFQLTNAQAKVVEEIGCDLQRQYPMLRLVQGDVGSGKTVVAAMAMLQAVDSGYQAVMMAPTELLAEQHHRVFKKWFAPLGIEVVFLSGNVKGAERKKVLAAIESDVAKVVLGTHAVFQEGVNFSALALIIVDEQHRFGVEQRALLRGKGTKDNCYPHQLIMTATPIPRTLAMSFYADLDCSVIDELPPGRTPIMTTVVAAARREEVIARMRESCQQGKQAYWVCSLIEESETIPCQAATKTAEELQQMLPEIKIGLIHGRMSAKEKELAMQLFQQGETQLLVATTVIEVGVDVPNASLMVIENAERLGLSQLHQLRGRVGRGSVASHCVLLYQYPLSNMGKERLAVMRETTDGFKIAQRDLELRGPGEVLGTKQTGELAFRIADLIRDSEILPTVHKAADYFLKEQAELTEPLIKRWLGKNSEYGKV